MKKSRIVPDWAWCLYQAKQEETRKSSNDAAEETLNYLVRITDAGDLPDTQAELERMIDNHLAGQRQKIRRRQRIMENVVIADSFTNDASVQRASSLESLSLMQNSVTPSQWRLIAELANGNSYRQLSADRKSSLGTIKSSVSRLRKRLRKLVFENDSISMAA